jgi:hypothetical protein
MMAMFRQLYIEIFIATRCREAQPVFVRAGA